jgi:hypothetical protein
MKNKPIIWLIDTSILLNVINMPNINQAERALILSQFRERIEREDTFLLPYAAIVETGNHIAQLKGDYKFIYADKFVKDVKAALNGDSPWKPLKFPTFEALNHWLDGFPKFASEGIGFADYSMIKEWEEQKALFPAYSVRIWSLDNGLQGYES